ncbi:MAG: acylneuraminate cytidylyltransferase family protein [Candidatus Stygibacter australis]|nr:acylneuraminate cytidylyltransferase family protein [Candidatus Stygibacter australis]MDP8321131.1 acylneuraminate cytidylyltransferase family protein [Candidatus Stygibacter australis]
MEVLGIIPARGGSKGIPGKNIKLLSDKPLIDYSIKAAQNSKLLNKFIVSTDSDEIANICKLSGAEVPFIRPEEFARDDTPDRPMILHALEYLKENQNYIPDMVVLLRPTTPFKTGAIIDECITKLCENKEYSSLRTVTQTEGVHHPYWMFSNKDGFLKTFIDGINLTEYHRRQLLPECYRLNGVVDVLRTDNLLKYNDIYGDKVGYISLSEYDSIDIDNQFDFDLCEYILRNVKSKISGLCPNVKLKIGEAYASSKTKVREEINESSKIKYI